MRRFAIAIVGALALLGGTAMAMTEGLGSGIASLPWEGSFS